MLRTLLSCVVPTTIVGCTESHGVDTDGGGLDGGGASACDAGPIDLCRAPTGTAGCCGEPIAPVCSSGGGLTCPPGAVRTAECTSFAVDGACDTPSPQCLAPTDCTLLPESCCGSCGAPTPGDMTAVPNDRADEHRAAACAGGVGCPACFMEPDPFLLATCDTGRCVAVDLRAEALTLCTVDAECQLAPRECCACGVLGPADVVAYNPERGSYYDLICDPRLDCPPCVPAYDGVEAGCDAGRCVVRIPMP